MEYTEHYDDMEQRNNLCDIAEGNGFRMLHDDFDEDWKRGDEPHGTLTFTDEPSPGAPAEPPPEPLVFTPANPELGVEQRINQVEEFLKRCYPE